MAAEAKDRQVIEGLETLSVDRLTGILFYLLRSEKKWLYKMNFTTL